MHAAGGSSPEAFCVSKAQATSGGPSLEAFVAPDCDTALNHPQTWQTIHSESMGAKIGSTPHRHYLTRQIPTLTRCHRGTSQ